MVLRSEGTPKKRGEGERGGKETKKWGGGFKNMGDMQGVYKISAKGRYMCPTYSWGPIFGVGCAKSMEAGFESQAQWE